MYMATISEALATALNQHQAGNIPAAEQIYRQILSADPNHADAWHLLGVIAHQSGKHYLAIEYIGRAINLKDRETAYHNNLGAAYRSENKLDEAITCFKRALELEPGNHEARNNLGNALKGKGKLAEAVTCFRKVLDAKPDDAEVHNNLGLTLKEQGMLVEAVACYRTALQLQPSFAIALNNLGNALRSQGNLDDAVSSYRQALQLRPNYSLVYCNLGNALKDQGQLEAAITCFRRALELDPKCMPAQSSLTFATPFCQGYDTKSNGEEARRWHQQFAQALAHEIRPHPNDRSIDRRLRIGYVSPNFRNHCQAFFTTPLLSSHDHEAFEIVCYSDVVCPDETTARLREHADGWHEIVDLTDEQVAQRVRQDQIDVLVDLTMHLDGSRLLVFARKPAPVQVCWLAYPGTTGLATIDYRLTDPQLDPPGVFDRFYSEESVRLPDTFWCYDPLTDNPAVSSLPALSNGYVTFGCLNNFCKVNVEVLRLWAKVLKSVDRSQLLLMCPGGSCRERVCDIFRTEGIARERVSFVAFQPRAQYLQLYEKIDIGLDTFPANGHTTSLDAFFMGVPVVTLVGDTVLGRAGLSQLKNLNLLQLAAASRDQFVQTAADLAGDLPRLRELRETLRERMRTSPLMDAPRFAKNLESSYRWMWQRWCGEGG
jgi:predicted O-linked N-acetylglucosamine transferase (SPINDLY family)